MITERVQTFETKVVTTSSDASTASNFSNIANESLRKLIIQNTGSNTCHVKLAVNSNPTATTTDGIQLVSGQNVVLDGVRFDYFAVINDSAGNNNTVRFIGMGM